MSLAKAARLPTTGRVIGIVLQRTQKAVEELTPREQNVLARRWGLIDGRRETLDEIASGDQSGMTANRARHVEVLALQKLSERVFGASSRAGIV